MVNKGIFSTPAKKKRSAVIKKDSADQKSGKKREKAGNDRQDLSGEINKNVPVLPEAPAGYLSLSEFAQKAGVSRPTLVEHKATGRFRPENMCFVKEEGKNKKLFIDWEAEGPGYMATRSRNVEVEVKTGESGKEQESTGPAGTIAEAKLKQAKLDIQKKELELKKAKNEVIPTETVTDLLKTIAGDIKGQLLALPPRMAAVLAAETDIKNIHMLMEKEIFNTLDSLSNLMPQIDQELVD